MNIAIAGYGVEGKSNYQYWSKDRHNNLTILDENAAAPRASFPKSATVILGPQAFDDLAAYDLVIRTAGLNPHKLSSASKIWSATNEFFAHCPATIIGVTGSKGKGTTASFITSILRAAGKTVWLVGNIGTPALDVLAKIKAEDYVVYELSSFQLWDAQYSPSISVVLFIEQEHLDVHKDMDEYVQAKANIVLHQQSSDTVIYQADNVYAAKIAKQSAARRLACPNSGAAHIKDAYFWYADSKICPISAVKLKGQHNIQNALAAIEACWLITQNKTAIANGLAAFGGLPHRLEFVRTVNDVEYYDDSIATTPSSAIAALCAFANQPKVIILGGSYKGSDFSELARELAAQSDTQALLIGDEAKRLQAAFKQAGFNNYQIIIAESPLSVMQTVVQQAAALARPGGVVLLSPAAASFGLFQNYSDRGEQYTKAVNSL